VLYRRVLAIAETELGPEHPTTASALYDLGSVLISLGYIADGKRFLLREITLLRKLQKSHSPSLLISLQNLGVALCDAGEFDESELYLSEALQIANHNYSMNAIGTLPHLKDMGTLRFRQKRFADAKIALRTCLSLHNQHFPDDDNERTEIQTLIDSCG